MNKEFFLALDMLEKEKGIFAEAFADMGINVEYAELTSGADQTQALASGDVQVLYAVGATSVILSAANDADIKVLNMYSRSPEAFCLFAQDNTLTSPENKIHNTHSLYLWQFLQNNFLFHLSNKEFLFHSYNIFLFFQYIRLSKQKNSLCRFCLYVQSSAYSLCRLFLAVRQSPERLNQCTLQMHLHLCWLPNQYAEKNQNS